MPLVSLLRKNQKKVSYSQIVSKGIKYIGRELANETFKTSTAGKSFLAPALTEFML